MAILNPQSKSLKTLDLMVRSVANIKNEIYKI
jgi:hypothetical protein